jgi:organic radical activating enzyme
MPLPIMESYLTLQGEGFHQGKPAYFIRTGGCDVGCFWCDVKQSWPLTGHSLMSVEALVEEAGASGAEIVVVTGGEPLMHDLKELTTSLQIAGLKTHLETSGTYTLTGDWNWICLSPKKFKPPLDEIMSQAHELKVIVYNQSDFDWGERYAALVTGDCRLFLQPEWSHEKEMIPLITDYIMQHPRWRISVQLHKYLNLP